MGEESHLERVINADSKAAAAHTRLDRLEILIAEELREMKRNDKERGAELKELIALANKAKGWLAAASLFGGIVGMVFGAILTKVLSKWVV